MGIRFYCPNGHKLNVKEFQAGRRGICPYCGSKFLIPSQSTRKSSKEERAALRSLAAASAAGPATFPSRQTEGENPTGTSGSPISAGLTANVSASVASAHASGTASSTRLVDPITAAGNVVWYIRPPIGGQFGPATGGIVRQWLTEGRITSDTLVWREGWRDWQKAAAIFSPLQLPDNLLETALSPVLPGARFSQENGQESGHGKTQNTQKLMVALLILAVIILGGIFLWLIIHGLTSGTDNPAPLDPSRTSGYTQSSSHAIKPNRPPH